jgi:uncharacterized protein YecE (DUF72 family)
MWAHAAWPGRHVPASRTPLATYARLCNAVEGNTTFYALPSVEVATSWAEQAPADFRIVCKLPREITHHRRLRDVAEPLAMFLAAIDPLGERAEQLSVQLPGSFAPADLAVLSSFLRQLPGDRPVGVEVRHPDFLADGPARMGLLRTLERHGADLVVFDSRVLFADLPTSDAERDAWARKPRLEVHAVALGPRPVVRVIGRDDLDRCRDGLRSWVAPVVGWCREGRKPTVFVHTPDNVDSPLLAREFHAWVRAELPDVAPLPEPLPVRTAVQERLFG